MIQLDHLREQDLRQIRLLYFEAYMCLNVIGINRNNNNTQMWSWKHCLQGFDRTMRIPGGPIRRPRDLHLILPSAISDIPVGDVGENGR
jgi:hypothetical protein